MHDKSNQNSILGESYAGPNRWVAAGSLGAVEAKLAAIPSVFIGMGVGQWQHKPINNFLTRYPVINEITEACSGLLGKKVEKKINESKSGKAILFSTVAASFGLPLIAFVHGTWKGYHDANEGLKQFHKAQDEIRSLQDEVTSLKSEKQSWQEKVQPGAESQDIAR